MKKLERLKLGQLTKGELADRQMNGLKGGYFCVCGACGRYEATEDSNQSANSKHDYKTDGKCTNWVNSF